MYAALEDDPFIDRAGWGCGDKDEVLEAFWRESSMVRLKRRPKHPVGFQDTTRKTVR